MSLADMPLDVVLELTFFLDLQDSLRLLVTCSSFESLTSSKDFWLKTLHRIQFVHRQPLPCPLPVDLLSLPIQTLRKLAIHAYTLRRNWTSKRAFPVSVKHLVLDDNYLEICVIPGTRMVVTNTAARLVCWDTMSGARLGEIHHRDLDADCRIGRAPPFQTRGECYIGLASKSRTSLRLMGIKIDYRNIEQVIVSLIHCTEFSTPELKPVTIPDVSLDDKVIGMVYTSSIHERSVLVYSRLGDSTVHFVPLGLRAGSYPVCVRHADDFYVNGQDKSQPYVALRIPSPTAGNGNGSKRPDVERIPIPTPDVLKHFVSSAPALLVRPTYGVLNVTRETSWLHDRTTLRSVYFWPAHMHPSSESESSAGTTEIVLAPVVAYAHPLEILGLACGASGRYALLMDQEERRPNVHFMRPKTLLGLVRYLDEAEKPTFHRLDTAGVEINFYTATVALDDSLGVVYVSHVGQGGATLSVLCYA